MYSLDFDKDSDEFAQWTVVMPSDWNAGTVTAVAYWTFAAPGAGGETIEIEFSGRSYADSDAIDQDIRTGAQAITDTAITAADVHISAACSAMTINGTPAASELVHFVAMRDVSGDNLASDLLLLGIMVTYTRT
jgi:hypothetical protein